MPITNQGNQSKKVLTPRFLFILGLLALASLGLIFGFYFYLKYQSLQKNTDIITQKEIKKIVSQIEKSVELPKDETPSLATVSDKEKLKDQSFFKNAENGDKVLIYTQARKAILYRPSINKVIEIAPLSLSTSDTNANTNTAITALKVALFNGSGTVGLTASAETKLKEKMSNLTITTKDNAKKSGYTKTIVTDLSGIHESEAKEIAGILEGEVGPLPAGETKPDADIAVIVVE